MCRAYVLTEAAWPQGAELCVTVTWTPDAALRRDGRTGRVPTGAEEHWRMRIAATAQALESLGYLVEPSRFRCSPRYYFTAELLVYRMPAGVPPRQRPAATAGRCPRPFPALPAMGLVSRPLAAGRRPRRPARGRTRLLPAGPDPFGRIAVRDITQTVWPPEAALCVWLTWWPTTAFARDPGTGLAPDGAEEHWRECLDRLQQALTGAGLALRSRARPWNPDTDETADVLVYRATSRSRPRVTVPLPLSAARQTRPSHGRRPS